QAKLLKAEALYKQQKFGEAAAFYDELRASQLAPKLRAEAAYKQGWCAVQMKDGARAIEAFSYFIKTFPDSPQTPIALTQRALASLDTARRLNREQYYNPATLRIILAHYYLRDRKTATSEVDAFLASTGNVNIPPEVLEWLGIEYYNDKNYLLAEKYFGVLGRIENPVGVKPDFWFYLGDVASKLKHYDEAENAYSRYLQNS